MFRLSTKLKYVIKKKKKIRSKKLLKYSKFEYRTLGLIFSYLSMGIEFLFLENRVLLKRVWPKFDELSVNTRSYACKLDSCEAITLLNESRN